MSIKKVKIKWKDLRVGDIFPDGSEVTAIREWQMQTCYEMTMDGKTLVCSDDHLLKCLVKDLDRDSLVINLSFDESALVRQQIGVRENNWLCASDIFNAFHDNEHNYQVIMLDHECNERHLDNIELFDDGKPQQCRCITTTYGCYTINGFINHNTGTMDSMSKGDASGIIRFTVDAWGTSPIIQSMRNCETTEECRQTLFDGLKKEYEEAGIKEDDFNLMMIARKMTSYKRVPGGLRPVEPGEKCDIVSALALGSYNNIFKNVELTAGYKYLTTPMEQEIGTDAANQILN